MQSNITTEVYFTLEAINPDGSVASALPRQHNLVTDNGLNLIAGAHSLSLQTTLMWGTGALVTKRASGAITVALAAGVLTADAAFFVAADVGRIFKFATGEEVRIAAYTSATSVTTADARTIAAAIGTIHYVNLAALVNQVGYLSGATTTTAARDTDGTYTWRRTRTFLTEAFAATSVITELAWGPANGNIFGLHEIVAFPVAAGQQMRVTLECATKSSIPFTPAAVANFGTNVDASGTMCMDNVLRVWSIAEPSQQQACGIIPVAFSHTPGQAADLSIYGNGGCPANASTSTTMGCWLVSEGYTAGTFTLTRGGTMAAGSFSGTVYGLAHAETDGSYPRTGLHVKFTTPFTVTKDDSLKVKWTYTWGRTLVN